MDFRDPYFFLVFSSEGNSFYLCAFCFCGFWDGVLSPKPTYNQEIYLKSTLFLGEPHTDIVDGMMMQLFIWYYRIGRLRFLVKSNQLKGLKALVIRKMGGIPVRVSKGRSMSQALIKEFNRADQLILHIAPSGTRKKSEYWRSGFYYIARELGISVVPAFLNACDFTFGYGAPMLLSDDRRADMDEIRKVYRGKVGFKPECSSEVRLKQEV